MANFLGKFPKDKITICCILTDMDKKQTAGSGFKIKVLLNSGRHNKRIFL